MQRLVIILACLCCVNAHASYFPPPSVQKQIETYENLNDKCRGGSGDNPQTIKSCEKRDTLQAKIKKMGWCWGAFHPNATGAEKQWIPCKLNKS